MITPSATLISRTAAKIRQPRAKVYVKWDGTNWTDESARIKSVEIYEELGGELEESGVSECDLVFANVDNHFTLGHANCSITAAQYDTDVLLKVELGFGDETIQRFYGVTKELTPDHRAKEFKLYAWDYSNTLLNKLSGYSINLGQRTDQLIAILATVAGLTSSDWDLETGDHLVRFAFFDDRNIWNFMQEVAEAEAGRVFIRGNDGKLYFWNRTHLKSLASSFTFKFDDYVKTLNYNINDTARRNVVRVEAKPRYTQASQIIWQNGDPAMAIYAPQTTEIPGNSSVTFWADFEDPVTTFITPVSGTDFTANAAADGSGADRTSSMSVSTFDTFVTTAKLVVANSHASSIYITKLQIRGTPARVYREIAYEVQDDTSVAKHGKLTKILQNDFIDDEDYVITLANELLTRYKDLKADHVYECIGVPYLEVGDVCSFQEIPDSASTTNYMIKNMTLIWSPEAGARMRLGLTAPL